MSANPQPVPDAQVTRERAARDLAAIVELQKNDSFQGYFVRRLKEKIARTEKSLKYDKMSLQEREDIRQQLLAFEEILGWTSTQEAVSAQSMAAGGRSY